MRMVLVHGINQQGKSPEKIINLWINSLHATYAKYGHNPLSKLSRIEAAFYGDRIESLTATRVEDQTIALGANDDQDDFSDFALAAFREGLK